MQGGGLEELFWGRERAEQGRIKPGMDRISSGSAHHILTPLLVGPALHQAFQIHAGYIAGMDPRRPIRAARALLGIICPLTPRRPSARS